MPDAKSKSGGNLSGYQVLLTRVYAASLLPVVMLGGDWRSSGHHPTKYHCRELEGACKANTALHHDRDKNKIGV